MVLSCSKCGITPNNSKDLKNLPSGVYCKKCAREKRDERRDELLHTIGGIRRRKDLEIEWDKKREEKKQKKEKKLKEKQEKPKIRGTKERKNSRQLHFYLTREERQFLFKKYTHNGFSPEAADEKIKKDAKYLEDLVKRLREEKKSKEEIGRRFREEFSKLIEIH